MQIRRMRLAAAVVAASLLATACGSDDTATDGDDTTQGTDTEGTEGGDTLVIGTTEKPANIDPARVYEKFASDILFNTTDRLVALEPGTGDAVPGVAESWEISEDGLTYTFDLRDGVTFQDGSELTSEDVKWSIERSLNINHPDGASFLIGSITSVEAPDPDTVVITIASPNVTFLSRLAYTVATILPSDSGEYSAPDGPLGDDVTPEAADEFLNPSTIVGSGPYQLTSYDPDLGATLEAWDGYWGEAPKVDTVKIQFFNDSAQMAQALQNGEIDLNINDMGPAERSALESAEGINVQIGDGGRIRYLVIDVNQAPFDDAATRRAIASAIDRQRIIDDVFEGAGQPIFSMIPPGYPASKDYISTIDESVEGPIEFELWYPLNKYGDTEADVAETIARSLNETGVFNVTTKSADWASEFVNNLSNGVYGIYLLGWYPDYIDPDDYIDPFMNAGGFLGFYNNDEMTNLIVAEQEETDLDARTAIFDDIQKLAAQDMPLIPLYEESATAYFADGISGVENSIDVALASRWWLISKS